MIELGDKVKDKYCGFTGIAVSKTIYINGCVQFGVLPKVDKTNKVVDPVEIDEENLVVVKPKKKAKIPKPLGGQYNKGYFG